MKVAGCRQRDRTERERQSGIAHQCLRNGLAACWTFPRLIGHEDFVAAAATVSKFGRRRRFGRVRIVTICG